MGVELKMPALSPTMEEGTLAKWLVKEGDNVSSGDILAEIETDKATMEFEAGDEADNGARGAARRDGRGNAPRRACLRDRRGSRPISGRLQGHAGPPGGIRPEARYRHA